MDRLDSAPSGTTRNAVEGRQRNDRRKAGVPVAQHRDRPNRTRSASTIPGFHRKLPVCLGFLRSGSNLFRRRHQPFGDGRRVHRDGSVCPFWRALKQRSASAGGIATDKCVDQTLQLVEARRERLQRGCNVCVQTVGCNVRGCLRHLHLCGFLLRFLGGGAGAATCLGAQGCRSGRERSEDPKVPGRSGDAGQFWWSFAATLCVLPSSLSIPSRRRRHRSSRSAICSTAAPGSRPSSCPRHR